MAHLAQLPKHCPSLRPIHSALRSLIVIAPMVSFVTACDFGKERREQRIQQGMRDWQAAVAGDDVDSYFDFIALTRSGMRRYSAEYDGDMERRAQARFVERLKEEHAINLSIVGGANIDRPTLEQDLAYLSYLSDLRNADVIVAIRGAYRTATYARVGGGVGQRDEELRTGGSIKGTLLIRANATGAILSTQDFRFSKSPPRRTTSAGFPIARLYADHVRPLLLGEFSKIAHDRMRFLFALFPLSTGLSQPAAVLLLRPVLAEELGNPDQLDYVIDLLDNARNPRTRCMAAYALAYSGESTAVQALMRALGDEAKKRGRREVASAATSALQRLSREDPSPLLAALRESAEQRKDLRGSGMTLEEWRGRAFTLKGILEDMPLKYAVAPLISLLSSSDESTVGYAVRTLEKRTGESFGVEQWVWSQWWRFSGQDDAMIGRWFDKRNNPGPQARGASCLDGYVF